MYLRMLEKMEMDFEENGEPAFTLVMHPDMAEVVCKRMLEWQTYRTFHDRYIAVIRLKREAWLERESNRQLVD
jgi:hypothetical protein